MKIDTYELSLVKLYSCKLFQVYLIAVLLLIQGVSNHIYGSFKGVSNQFQLVFQDEFQVLCVFRYYSKFSREHEKMKSPS